MPVKHLQKVGNSNQFPNDDNHSDPQDAPRNLEMRVVVSVAPDFDEADKGQNEYYGHNRQKSAAGKILLF